MKKVFLTFMAMCFLIPVALAQQSEGIAAVVNDEAISYSDLEDRIQLVILSSNLPNNAEIRERVLPQVINSLIEERIKLQETARLEIEVKEEEINTMFGGLAEQNNVPADKFEAMLVQSKINPNTLKQQLRTQIAWQKLIQARLMSKIAISDNDIDTRMQQLRGSLGTAQYLVAEIFLPVEKPDDDGDVKQLADRLVSQLTQGQAPFFKVAQQFSKAAGAAQGGDMGWVQAEQLPKELAAVIDKIGKDEISPPIRSLSGYHILFVRDKRVITEKNIPVRDEVRNQIGLERLDRLQRRYFRDLKSAAFVDARV